MQASPNRTRQLQFRWAGALLLAQGVLMEGLVFVGLLVFLALNIPQAVVTQHVDVFVFPYLQNNLYLMMGMSGIFAALRVLGAIGLMRYRLWGLGLSIINCAVTLVLMVFFLPAGLLDGFLSGAALVLMLYAWLGREPDGKIRVIA